VNVYDLGVIRDHASTVYITSGSIPIITGYFMIDLANKYVYVRDLVFGLYVGPRVAYRR